MIVRVGLDSGGLSELAQRDTLEIRASQRLLLWHLTQCAILVHADVLDRERLASAVESLPQELRKIWTSGIVSLMSVYAKDPINLALAEVLHPNDLLDWAGQIALALVGTERASRLGLDSAVASDEDDDIGIEVTRLAAVHSTRLLEALEVQRADIGQGQTRDEVWNERFATAASTGEPITILDRYAVAHLASSLKECKQNGLYWLLEKIATETSAPVHLIAASGRSGAGTVISNLGRINQRLPGLGVQTLSVTLAAHSHFQKQSHPRHLRFGPIAIALDRGLSIFDEQRCSHSVPCTRTDRNAARKREEEIEHQAFRGFRRAVVW